MATASGNGMPRWVEDALARHEAALGELRHTEDDMRTSLSNLQAEYRVLRADLLAQMRELRGRVEARAPWISMAFQILTALLLTYLAIKK